MKNKSLLLVWVVLSFLLLLGVVSAVPVAPDNSSVLAYWSFEDSGTTLNDLTSNNLDVTLFNSPLMQQSGILDYSSEFEMSNSEYGLFNDINPTTSFSVNTWVYVKDFTCSTNIENILDNSKIGVANYYSLAYVCDGASGGYSGKDREVFMRTRTSSTTSLILSGFDLTPSTWHMVTTVFDGTNITLYIDGDYKNSVATASNTMASNVYDWGLGVAMDGDVIYSASPGYLDARLDETFLTTEALTQNNIDYLFSSGSPSSSQQYPFISNVAPTFGKFNVSNVGYINTNDVIDVEFNVTDDDQDDLNISVTWFKSTDGGSTYSAHITDNESWLNQAFSNYNGTTYNTTSSGDLEASDTSYGDYWIPQGTVTDGTANYSVNGSAIFINNTAPSISSVDITGTPIFNDDIVNVDFLVSDTDSDDLNISLTWFYTNANSTLSGISLTDGQTPLYDVIGDDYTLTWGSTSVDLPENCFNENSEFTNNFGLVLLGTFLSCAYHDGSAYLITDSYAGENISMVPKWTSHSSDDESWLNQAFSTYNGTTYNTTSSGDLEAADIKSHQFWKTGLSVTDGVNTTSQNSSIVKIQNTPPVITSSSSDTTLGSAANVGDSVVFTVSGTDAESNPVVLKVCDTYPSANYWYTCSSVLCSQETPVSFDNVTPADITCTYTATSKSSRENTAYAFIFDGTFSGTYTLDGNVTNDNITYFVNSPATLENYSSQDTGGGTTYFFGEYMDFFQIDLSDDYTIFGTPTIRVTDGTYSGGTRLVDDEDMLLDSGNTYKYDVDTYINDVGTFNVYINYTDSDGAVSWYNTSFTSSAISVETGGRIYAYDYETLPTNSQITTGVSTYGYTVSEIHIDKDSNWTDVSNVIQTAKNNSELIILTYELQEMVDRSLDEAYVSSHFSDLIDSDHLNAMRQIKFYATDTDSAKTSPDNSIYLLNLRDSVIKTAFQNTSNKIPIYFRNLGSSYDSLCSGGLSLYYFECDDYIYITASDEAGLLDKEVGFLRNNTDKSRLYYNLTDPLKSKAGVYQDNIINKMRSTINTSTSYVSNVGELSNGDVIVFNNHSSPQTFDITTYGVLESHAYDLTSQTILTDSASSGFNITVPAYTADMVYFSDLTKVIIEDDNDKFLYGEQPRSFDTVLNYTSGDSNAFAFTSSSANPDDGRIIFTDPSYNDMGFYVWYGTNQFEAIGDWSKYSQVIIGDYSNSTWVSNIASITSVFGYVSVNDYGNNNEPVGCTEGVDCTSWNRSLWIDEKEAEIDVWTDINSSVNIFIDGLDIGAVNDVDGLFGDSLISLSDYVKISKGRSLILNTYTNYEDFANLGDYTMRESACGRWDGTTSSPTYTYENINTEIQRANYHKSHGVPVLAQVFGNITDYEKAHYCFMQTKVLYGDLASVSYNQPLFDYTGAQDDFQWNYFKFPDLGNALEESYSVVGSDSYSRRFENGIVEVNTTSHEVTYTTNDVVGDIELCGYFYDNSDSAEDEGYMHFVINDNMSRYFNIADDDLTAFVKTYKCGTIPAAYYEPSGFYELEFYYIDNDGTYTGNTPSMYMYHGEIAGEDRLSFWEQTLNDHPSNDETDYWFFSTGDNWALDFTIERTVSESAIDDVTSVIDRISSGVEKVTVNVTSDDSWSVPIYDREQVLNKSILNGVFVSGNESKPLNYALASNCNTSSPVYALTTFNSTPSYTTNVTYWDNSSDASYDGWSTNGLITYYTGEPGEVGISFDDQDNKYVYADFSNVYALSIEAYNQDSSGSNSSLSVYLDDVLHITYYDSDFPSYPSILDPLLEVDTDDNVTVKLVGRNVWINEVIVAEFDDPVETWKMCTYNSSGTQYFKVVLPELSDKSYVIDGNTHPTIDVENFTLDSLEDENQSWSISFNYSDADGNSISSCVLEVDGVNSTSSPSGEVCSFSVNKYLNSSSNLSVSTYVIDEYDDSSSDGSNINLANIVYSGIGSDNQSGSLSNQYFRKHWNITQSVDNFSNILFSYDNLTARTVDLVSGVNDEYLIYTTNLIDNSSFYLVPDAADEYTVSGAETMFKYFNVTANLSTGEFVPYFNVSLPMDVYTSGVQAITTTCSTFNVSYTNFTSGSDMIVSLGNVANGSVSCFNYSYKGTPVYSNSTLNFTDSGSERTYFFSNEDSSDYGSKIKFYFDSLKDSSIDLTYSLQYSDLTNWANRDSSSKQVYRFNSPSTYTQESITTDYTFVDNAISEIVEFNWPSTNSPYDNLFVNLSWVAQTVVYQCNDGLDNDGDGLVDFPADPDCTSSTDNSEATVVSGGGGGGSVPVIIDESCKVSIEPDFLRFTSNGIRTVEVVNTGTTSYNPSFKFDGVISPFLSRTNSIDVSPGSTSEFGIRYDSVEFVEGEATLTLNDVRCGEFDILIKADAVVTPADIIGDLFEITDNETFVSNILGFVVQPVASEGQPTTREATKFFTIGVLYLIIFSFVLFLLWTPISSNWQDKNFRNSFVWIGFALVVAFVATLFLIWFFRNLNWG